MWAHRNTEEQLFEVMVVVRDEDGPRHFHMDYDEMEGARFAWTELHKRQTLSTGDMANWELPTSTITFISYNGGVGYETIICVSDIVSISFPYLIEVPDEED